MTLSLSLQPTRVCLAESAPLQSPTLLCCVWGAKCACKMWEEQYLVHTSLMKGEQHTEHRGEKLKLYYQSHWVSINLIPIPTLVSIISIFGLIHLPLPFILMRKMNVITDYDQLFCPIIIQTHIAPVFHKTHIFWTFWRKNGIFQTHIGRKLILFRTTLLHNRHKHTFKWS